MKHNHPFSVMFNQNVVNRRLCRCVIGKIVFKSPCGESGTPFQQKEVYQ